MGDTKKQTGAEQSEPKPVVRPKLDNTRSLHGRPVFSPREQQERIIKLKRTLLAQVNP